MTYVPHPSTRTHEGLMMDVRYADPGDVSQAVAALNHIALPEPGEGEPSQALVEAREALCAAAALVAKLGEHIDAMDMLRGYEE